MKIEADLGARAIVVVHFHLKPINWKNMSSKLDWDKARKRELVWRNGGRPSWQDTWGTDPKDDVLSVGGGSRSAAGPKTTSEFYLGDPFVLTVECPNGGQFIYRFYDLDPGGKGIDFLTESAMNAFSAGPAGGTEAFERAIGKIYAYVGQQYVTNSEGKPVALIVEARVRAARAKKFGLIKDLVQLDQSIRAGRPELNGKLHLPMSTEIEPKPNDV